MHKPAKHHFAGACELYGHRDVPLQRLSGVPRLREGTFRLGPARGVRSVRYRYALGNEAILVSPCGKARIAESDRGFQLFTWFQPAGSDIDRGDRSFGKSERSPARVPPICSLQLAIRESDEASARRSKLDGYHDAIDGMEVEIHGDSRTTGIAAGRKRPYQRKQSCCVPGRLRHSFRGCRALSPLRRSDTVRSCRRRSPALSITARTA